ncbi:cation diffusion facilitator family transporter [bacterium]|nr:cation diffusion facilitator family transporter [bacterium]
MEHSHDYIDLKHGHGKNEERDHKHGYKNTERRKLLITIIITTTVMIVEIAGGIMSKSLALISDAGHMFTHSFALLVSFFAIIYAMKKPTLEKSYGFYRVEILAALFNGIGLLIISGFIFWEAYKRILNPQPINALEMIIIAIIGLAANVASAFILAGSSKESLNVKSAFFHMIGDTASSVAIVIGGVIIYFTDFYLIDPIFSILICIAILYWAFILIRDSVQILMETTPRDMDVEKLKAELIKEIDGVEGVHDIHIWQITDSIYNMTAHVVTDNVNIRETSSILEKINNFLAEKYQIRHSVIQFETDDYSLHK